jgi:hypothetical protein
VLALELHRLRDEQLAHSRAETARIVDARTVSVDFACADEAVRLDKTLILGGRTISTSTVLARRGAVVLEFAWHGAASDLAWADRACAILAPRDDH